METITQVKELTSDHRIRLSGNVTRNGRMVSYYQRMMVGGVISKRMSWPEIQAMKERVKRLESCNKVWDTETYEASHVKVLLRTYLCKDRFCPNCQEVRRVVLWNRLMPYMERYKDSLYHMTLTVPDCTGEELYGTIRHMARCFKTLVTYLNGNKKVRGIDLMQYDFQGCFRSLEITYDGDTYHPHFEVAAVWGNGGGLSDQHIQNQFSYSRKAGMRLFSDFELMIQRMWCLLLNHQRLTYHNIVEDETLGRYSCTVNKFRGRDAKRLLNYVTKEAVSPKRKDAPLMSDDNFRTFYHALTNYRLRQGYGVFYRVKDVDGTGDYTEQDYQMLERYIISGDRPVGQYERTECLMDDNQYTILRARHRPESLKH